MTEPEFSFDGSRHQPPARNSRQVLVGEDDAMYRRVLQTLLQRASFEVTIVNDGAEALKAAQTPEAPRLLVLDWVMPGLYGPEICRRLRKNPASERYQYVLLLTSKDTKNDTVEGLEAGADDYLTKPFDAQELLARLRAGMRILELQDRLLATSKELEYEATHDQLTGLWNRLAWKKLLSAEWERARRNERSLTVLMMDIDHFKAVNDLHGHSAGDNVLCELGKALASMVRAYDVAGRYGGEEFIVVAPQLSPEAANEYASRIRTQVAALIVPTGATPISVTVSIGVAHTERPEDCTVDELVRAADRALYTSKTRGRNCVTVERVEAPLAPASQAVAIEPVPALTT